MVIELLNHSPFSSQSAALGRLVPAGWCLWGFKAFVMETGFQLVTDFVLLNDKYHLGLF